MGILYLVPWAWGVVYAYMHAYTAGIFLGPQVPNWDSLSCVVAGWSPHPPPLGRTMNPGYKFKARQAHVLFKFDACSGSHILYETMVL